MKNELSLVPLPVELKRGEGTLTIEAKLDIVAVVPAREAASYLGALLERRAGASVRYIFPDAPGFEAGPPPSGVDSSIRRVRFISKTDSLGSEGYHLTVGDGEIVVEAGEPSGFFWATQTLRQLLPPSVEASVKASETPLSLPKLTITDHPRFSWRGLHFDVSRHFFPVPFLKQLIDVLALYKLNRFHFHLTDDQGWRIEIKRYPELTEVGAWRREGGGERHGGYYTQEEIREIVSYAAERQITVVPEIEMPGHSLAAIAALPWLSCTKEVTSVWDHGGISRELLCAGREETFEFIENVLDEVAELFPSELIHIGGDECPKERWKACPDCQARMREEGLQSEEELQGYFVRRVQRHLAKLGKRLVGWDEILEGGLSAGATVMSWRGVEGGIAAAKAGLKAVMTPVSHCYFDYRQSANPGELGPSHFKPPITTLERVYSYQPIPEGIPEEYRGNILGSQGNVWTEDIDSPERAGYMIFPRLCALAEVLWSPAALRDWESFKGRLASTITRLDALGVAYCRILESLA